MKTIPLARTVTSSSLSILTVLLITPPAAVCGAADSPRPAAQPSHNLPATEAARAPYNVLFIAIDDLNDWVGCLGGKEADA